MFGGTMDKESWRTLLRCPADGGNLDGPAHVERMLGDWTGELVCRECGAVYPVERGIARFVDVTARTMLDHPAMRDEMVARDRAASAYEKRFSATRNAIELVPCLRALDLDRAAVVAELGCGTGRVTRKYVLRVSSVVAVDFSLTSLRELRAELAPGMRERVLLVQGDMTALPLADAAFDRVASFQALEHLPTPELRLAAVQEARRIMVRSARVVVTMYHWSWWKQHEARRGRGDNTLKEGYHATEPPVYFVNFEVAEARALFAAAGVRVDSLAGLQLQLPLLSLLGPIAIPLHRALSRTELGIRHAHLLLVEGGPQAHV